MKKTLTRNVVIAVEKLCDVTYYIWAEPLDDPHFRVERPYVLCGRYFDTKEEAETFLADWEKDHVFFGRLTIGEKVTELE